MKKILLASLFVGASFVNIVRAEEIAGADSEMVVSEDVANSEQAAQEAPAFVKQEQVILVNRSPFPTIFAIYDTVKSTALRRVDYVENEQVTLLSRDFFANQMQQLLSSDTDKLAVGSSYGVEKMGPNQSAFMPEWKGIVLETQDLIFLSMLFNEVNVVELSMILIGNMPILCINAPEAKMSFSIPCGEIKQVFGQNYPLFQACLGTKELTQTLWGSSTEKNPSYDQMIMFLQQVIVQNIQAQQAAAQEQAQASTDQSSTDASAQPAAQQTTDASAQSDSEAVAQA